MPPSKENEVLTAPPEASASTSSAPAPRFDETATGSRPQPVALEVPVTVNGARPVEGTDKREPFSESTKTVLVFGNGAVIRLGSPVAAGQLLFLTNEKTKKEVVCQVVKSKNYRSVSGYVELEFTESVVGFWGMRFPSDRIGAQAPAPAPAAKINPVASIPTTSKPVSPVLNPAARVPDTKPIQSPAAPIHAEVRIASQPQPIQVSVPPPPPKPQAQPVQAIPAPVMPTVKKPDLPAIPAPANTSSLASSLASLLSAPELPPAAPPSKPAAVLTVENKLQPANVPAQASTEELKHQTARLQEQLSSLLFSAAPTPKPVPSVPAASPSDPKGISEVAAKVFEIAKSEPPTVKPAAPAKPLPAPIKSSLDTEEVKIPSWLEPLARNAAAQTAPQEPVEHEKPKHASEIPTREEHSAEVLPVTSVEGVPESALPAIGSLLPLDEPVITHERSSGGSGKGVLYGAIAAGALLVAGGAWYLMHPSNTVQSTAATTKSPSSQASATPPTPTVTQPATQPGPQRASQNFATTPGSDSGANAIASHAPLTKPTANPQPAPVTRDNTRGAGTTIPAAATERIDRPPAEPEPKKQVLGEVHLASPTMNRPASVQDDGAEAPTIPADNGTASGLDPGLAAGTGSQPAAPAPPLPVGGDVQAAKLLSSVAPVYPVLAKTQHVSGDVVIDALIDANGHVSTMKVISGPTLLHQAAMTALRQWKYQPATLDGKAVSMHLTVTMQFRPQ